MASVSLRAVSKHYSGAPAVNAVSFDVAEGEFVVILGASGCGKTTTLRMIAGFVEPSAGHILIGGEDVTHVPPRLRNIGMVFQNYALFPNMTVAGNIAFGLRQRRAAPAVIAKRVAELLDLMQLRGRGDDSIDALSGGQQQRVALARALATSPRVLLMDEPLSALDLKLRETMRDEIQRIQRELRISTLFVTHDQQEAMSLADRVILMGHGDIQQIGPPAELYARPATPFVAEFIGKNNLLRGRVVAQADGIAQALLPSGAAVRVRASRPLTAGSDIEISVRPEALRIAADATADANAFPGVVERCRFLGNVMHCFVRAPWDQVLLIELPGHAPTAQPGDAVTVAWDPDQAVAFPARPA
jgi:putative spermidine/putrescine transport system ATP-binding protein